MKNTNNQSKKMTESPGQKLLNPLDVSGNSETQSRKSSDYPNYEEPEENPTDNASTDSFEAEEKVVEESPDKRFRRFDIVLGRGSFKTVYKGIDTETAANVAWCELRECNVSKDDLIRFREEAEMLKQLRHPNIVSFYDYWEEAKGGYISYVMITELLTSGTLKSYIKRLGEVKEKVVRKWGRQILEGLQFLHSRTPPVIHRDLKCDNVFINGSDSSVKLGDLGLATFKRGAFAKSVIGTPEFMAPEILQGSYDESVDIYAFGMCLLEMVTGEYPYSECTATAQIISRVCAGSVPDNVHTIKQPYIKALTLKCISSNKNERYTVDELLDLDFFCTDRDINTLKLPFSTFMTLDSQAKIDKVLADMATQSVDKNPQLSSLAASDQSKNDPNKMSTPNDSIHRSHAFRNNTTDRDSAVGSGIHTPSGTSIQHNPSGSAIGITMPAAPSSIQKPAHIEREIFSGEVAMLNFVDDSQESVNLNLVLSSTNSNKAKQSSFLGFRYDLANDTPENVASELIHLYPSQIPSDSLMMLSRAIEGCISNIKREIAAKRNTIAHEEAQKASNAAQVAQQKQKQQQVPQIMNTTERTNKPMPSGSVDPNVQTQQQLSVSNTTEESKTKPPLPYKLYLKHVQDMTAAECVLESPKNVVVTFLFGIKSDPPADIATKLIERAHLDANYRDNFIREMNSVMEEIEKMIAVNCFVIEKEKRIDHYIYPTITNSPESHPRVNISVASKTKSEQNQVPVQPGSSAKDAAAHSHISDCCAKESARVHTEPTASSVNQAVCSRNEQTQGKADTSAATRIPDTHEAQYRDQRTSTMLRECKRPEAASPTTTGFCTLQQDHHHHHAAKNIESGSEKRQKIQPTRSHPLPPPPLLTELSRLLNSTSVIPSTGKTQKRYTDELLISSPKRTSILPMTNFRFTVPKELSETRRIQQMTESILLNIIETQSPENLKNTLGIDPFKLISYFYEVRNYFGPSNN